MAERQGFEPWVPEGTPDFESGPFDQLWHLSEQMEFYEFEPLK